jgi:hypothetical protein
MTCAASMPGSGRPEKARRHRRRGRDQPDRAVRRRPGHRRDRDRRRPRRVPLRRPGPLRRLQRHRADRGVLRPAEGLPAVPAREPPARPRHPHGRGHPDPPPAQPGPRLLRQETGRGQDPQRSPARAETAGQQCYLACLQADARRAAAQPGGPGGQQGNDSAASAAGSHPRHRLFGQAIPGPGHHPTATPSGPPPGPARSRGTAGHSSIATLPPATPKVQVERPQRSEDERPGGAARRRPHSAARKATDR